MASPRQSSEEDWERVNAKSWELPHYGPSPGFDPGKRYTRRYNDEDSENRILESDDDRVSGQMSHDSSVPSLTKDVTNRSTLILPAVLTESRTTSIDSKHKQPHLASRKDRGIPGSSKHRGQLLPVPSRQNELLLKTKWRNSPRPDALFRLPYDYRVFQTKIGEQMQRDSSKTTFWQKLINDTGAYVCTSTEYPKLVRIWGQDSEVSAARNQLQEVVKKVIQQRNSPSAPRWDRIRAHSLAKDAHALSREYHEARLSSLRKSPKISTFCTLAFLWPSDGPSVNYCMAARREFVDLLRLKYDVNIYIKPGTPDYIYVSGNNRRDIGVIASRFRELWHNLMLQCETEIKLFLVDPPPVELMKTHIILQNSGQFSRAVLCGPQLAPEVVTTWKTTANGLKRSNKDVVTSRLKNALNVIPQFQGFLQMRVKFGSFALQKWRMPKNGTSYGFSEFREMISLMNTEGHLLPGLRLQEEQLLNRILTSDILKPYGQATIGDLLKLMPTYSANFEYRTSHDTTIRVEARFSLPPGSQEFEVNGVRCFKPQGIGARLDRQPPMQISMIDFQRSDWQFEIKALELCPESDVSPELEKFKRSIAFQWNSNAKSIGSAPQRKAKFAHGSKVTRFVEKAAVQLQVKNTPYVFEISRFDEYKYVAGQWTTTPTVSWGGWLFDPNWDDLLGEQAEYNIDNISKTGSLLVFFPSQKNNQKQDGQKQMSEEGIEEIHATEKEEEKQLRKFMSTVQQIARMLGSPSAEMPDVLDSDLGTLF